MVIRSYGDWHRTCHHRLDLAGRRPSSPNDHLCYRGCAVLSNDTSTELETQRVKTQLISASTSVGANYRAARRARSHAEFTAKIGVVAEEADESEYWLSVAIDLSLGSPETARSLHDESVELMKIFGKSSGTARSHRQG